MLLCTSSSTSVHITCQARRRCPHASFPVPSSKAGKVDMSCQAVARTDNVSDTVQIVRAVTRLGAPGSGRTLGDDAMQGQQDDLSTSRKDRCTIPSTLTKNEHLLPRLSLPLQLSPGREDAYARGLEHARAVEDAYQHLGRHYKLARVWETMGRSPLPRVKPIRTLLRGGAIPYHTPCGQSGPWPGRTPPVGSGA